MSEPVKTTLRTRDNDGNVVEIYPKTELDLVEGYEDILMDATCDDHTITFTKGDETEEVVEVSNEIITEEEILDLWNITISSEKSY